MMEAKSLNVFPRMMRATLYPCQQEKNSRRRHSERTRTLTEKGKAMQEDKIKTLKQRLNYTYNKWRTHVKISKNALSQITEAFSECLMQDILRDVKGLSGDVHHVYEDLRRVSTPDQDTRRRVDICTQVSDFIVAKVTITWMGSTHMKMSQIGR